MVNDKELTFNKFYILEFLLEVFRQVPDHLSGENSGIVRELIDHLKNKEDVTEGIETIAREQGSGELSIFLFDIVDRIDDYPPTVAYDALPDIVDDFISGLGLMMEEEETVTAIKNVNQQFRQEKGEKVVPEPEEVESELPGEEIGTMEEKAEAGPDESEIDFEEYYEIEFNQKIRDYLNSTAEQKIQSELYDFHELLINNLSTPVEEPETLVNLLSGLRTAMPWRSGISYDTNTIMKQEPALLKNYVENLGKLVKEDMNLITRSVSEGTIVLPEPEETDKDTEAETVQTTGEEKVAEFGFQSEEIPAEPTTIDAILSEYFQSEVNEHIEKLNENFNALKSGSEGRKELKDYIYYKN
jgi:hypothetical protein